ncbi:MAG: DUF1553 domain-containing protein, partial [Planctomycetaceae bacterium]|nr:DUF1553 domain-containing protein [Planctomycetaceae bacterium]
AKPVADREQKSHAKAVELTEQMNALRTRIATLEQQDAPEFALAVRDIETPSDSPIYRRGDFQNLGEPVPRGFLSAIPTSTSHVIPSDTSGRLQLADWLTDVENPVTSRVLVNRIWHHLFGQGLVRTVDSFGVHGESPSHPELLDYLAVRMRDDDNWSLKQTIRHIVLSHTYQMSSTYIPKAAEVDPDNRLLWHMPRRRLEAESIRDAMMSASGQLSTERGGPSLGLDLQGNINGLGGNVNPPTWAGKIPENIKLRRSVYLPLRRQRPLGDFEILSVFDFPHPSDITGARANTTVATQALFLLNAPFVKQQAEALAERLKSDVPGDNAARVNRLYLLTVSRPAKPEEVAAALAFVDSCMNELKSDEQVAWTQLCHAVLGSNSFLFCE